METADLLGKETAWRALAAYDLHPLGITALQHGDSLTWRVETLDGRYLLRLHHPRIETFETASLSRAALHSEILWLRALRRKNLPVPSPVAARSGAYVTEWAGEAVTVLAWQEGEALTRDLESESSAMAMGSLVGQLHAQASRWKPPAGFVRPSRDRHYFRAALEALRPALADGRMTYQDFKTLEEFVELLTATTATLRLSRQTWGMLHGDLHRGNFILGSDQLRLIDFSLCGWGHFAFDLGTCLSNLRTAYHPLFLEAYTRFFPLPPNFARLIEGYFLARHLSTFARSVADASVQEELIRRIPLIAGEYATRFNRDERFWFTPQSASLI